MCQLKRFGCPGNRRNFRECSLRAALDYASAIFMAIVAETRTAGYTSTSQHQSALRLQSGDQTLQHIFGVSWQRQKLETKNEA